MRVRTVRVLSMLGLAALLCPSSGYSQSGSGPRSKGFSVGAMGSLLAKPVLRPASGTGEMSVPQTKPTWGATAGFERMGDRAGFGLGVSYWRASLDDFQAPENPFDRPTSYQKPSYSALLGDLSLHWFPSAKQPVSLYGVLGLGIDRQSYTASNAVFREWNGDKTLTEFAYAWGLGTRVLIGRRLAGFAEYRQFPGDLSTKLEDCRPSGPGVQTCRVGASRTKNSLQVLSAGLAVRF